MADAWEADPSALFIKRLGKSAAELGHSQDEEDCPDILRRGDWGLALRLFEAERGSVREAVEKDVVNGHTFHRLRMVEHPLTPYMQWELHWLHLRAECGYPTRVLPTDGLGGTPNGQALPEVVVLDEKTLYRVLYTDSGATEAAVRFTDPQIVAAWVAWIRHAYEAAEDIEPYFARAVAPLPPPPAA
jgi:hypothetical protein